jgi:hypothetical protein
MRRNVWVQKSAILATACVIAQFELAADPVAVSKAWGTSIPHNFQGNPGPKFDRGTILARRVDSPEVFAWDRSGKLLVHTTVQIPNASEININDVAINPSGGFLVAGTARNLESQGAAFIAWLSQTGVVERVVRTSPFAALKICACSDGSIWAAGRELAPDHLNRMIYVPNHGILRRFDSGGRLTHSAVPRETFPSANHPVEVRSRLACADEKIGFFSPQVNEWIEISLEGTILGRWKGVPLSQNTEATGMNMLPDGSVYATTVSRLSSTPNPDLRAALFRLDRQQGGWVPVTVGEEILGADRKRHYAEIMGSDRSDLVIRTALPDVVALRVR